MEKIWYPLNKNEVIKAINHQSPERIPIFFAKWWGEGLREQYGDQLLNFDRFHEDITGLWLDPLINYEKMGLSWKIDLGGGYDNRPIITNWEKLEEFLDKLPNPNEDIRFEILAEQAYFAKKNDMYLIVGWWKLFFERPWELRGMSTLLMDYYLYPDKIHQLNNALCNFYIQYLDRIIYNLQPDGFWTSDDLGHQTQLFLRPTIFREFLMPYYLKIGNFLKKHNLHWWLHSCGNNTVILEDLIDAGVNVFHPVQKGTMDEIAVAKEFGDRLTFLAGIDVQHILQEATPETVRQEVRHLINTFDRPNGGLCIAAGNGIVAGTPIANIEAFLDEAYTFGIYHREKFNFSKNNTIKN